MLAIARPDLLQLDTLGLNLHNLALLSPGSPLSASFSPPSLKGQEVEKEYLKRLRAAGTRTIPRVGHDHDTDKTKAYIEAIVCAYEEHLKFYAPNDQWEACGRVNFATAVERYVAARRKVEFVIPAFPCKSSNLDKVSGIHPDKGEELALSTIKIFADEVSRLYPYGALIRIVSDGHVFSDLVGTDDDVVDTYNESLRNMADAIDGDGNSFAFAGLDELLRMSIFKMDVTKLWDTPDSGPLATHTTRTAIDARTILLKLFGEPAASIDARLSSDPALMGLARGFSKFVFEDTLQHPSLAPLSQSKKKRVAWNTAKLMILRNEAYSKLVECCFPYVVRLSIHPHNNAGPKFPISLIHPTFRGSSSGPAAAAGLFHIPTPWHNVALQLPQGGFVLLKRYMLQNLETTEHQVRMVKPNNPSEGAYFELVL